jgi:2'-5' RNA ligase
MAERSDEKEGAATTHRVFVAIPLSAELQEHAHTLRKAHSNLPIRWLEPKDLHITLIPPWHASDGDVASAIEKLSAIQRSGIAPFRIEFVSVEFGPNPRRPRLLWASGEAPEALARLRRTAYHLLGAITDGKRFRLHSTLARFRQEGFAAFPSKTLRERVAWMMTVERVSLLESHLLPQGASYTEIASFPLPSGTSGRGTE